MNKHLLAVQKELEELQQKNAALEKENVYLTDLLNLPKKENTNDPIIDAIEFAIIKFVKNGFIKFKLVEIKYTIKFLLDAINKISEVKVSETQIRNFLANKGYLKPVGNGKIKIPIDLGDNEDNIIFQTVTGRYFKFYYREWLTDDEQKSLYSLNKA